MEKANIMKNREGRIDTYTGESKIRQYQECNYEEAIARDGYKFYGRIPVKLFRSCDLYILQRADGVQTFLIDVTLHPLSEKDDPVHQFNYLDNFWQWVKEIQMLATIPEKSIHGIARESVFD